MIRIPRVALLVGGLLIAATECAIYEEPGSQATAPGEAGAGNVDTGGSGSSMSGSGGTAGSSSGAAAGGGPSPGGGQGVEAGGANDAAGGDASGGEGSSIGGTSPAGGKGGTAGTGGAGGKAGSGGMGGKGGAGGSAGAGGKGGSGGSGGAGGSSGGGNGGSGGMPSDVLLSRGKTAASDSEQTGHYADDGNDGDQSTRWCAAESMVNHYWEVDLGQSFTLRSLHILWEKNTAYLFKVETSQDHSAWSLALDQTASSTATADQKYTLPSGTSGRYVRMTVTGGLSATVWASFYEFEVFGY